MAAISRTGEPAGRAMTAAPQRTARTGTANSRDGRRIAHPPKVIDDDVAAVVDTLCSGTLELRHRDSRNAVLRADGVPRKVVADAHVCACLARVHDHVADALAAEQVELPAVQLGRLQNGLDGRVRAGEDVQPSVDEEQTGIRLLGGDTLSRPERVARPASDFHPGGVDVRTVRRDR